MKLEKRFVSKNGLTATLYNANCLDLLPIKSDAIITDPPYGIGFAAEPTKWARRKGYTSQSWDDNAPIHIVQELITLVDICAVWGGNYFQLPPSRGWLMWRKPDAPPSMAHGELAWTNQDQNLRVIDWSISATNPERVGHPTQKPVRVMTWTLDQVRVPKGALVFDPFMGVASTAIACLRTGRNFIGIELDPEYFKTACDRIERELDGQLF